MINLSFYILSLYLWDSECPQLCRFNFINSMMMNKVNEDYTVKKKTLL